MTLTQTRNVGLAKTGSGPLKRLLLTTLSLMALASPSLASQFQLQMLQQQVWHLQQQQRAQLEQQQRDLNDQLLRAPAQLPPVELPKERDVVKGRRSMPGLPRWWSCRSPSRDEFRRRSSGRLRCR